jgi:hypothetical protein
VGLNYRISRIRLSSNKNDHTTLARIPKQAIFWGWNIKNRHHRCQLPFAKSPPPSTWGGEQQQNGTFDDRNEEGTTGEFAQKPKLTRLESEVGLKVTIFRRASFRSFFLSSFR